MIVLESGEKLVEPRTGRLMLLTTLMVDVLWSKASSYVAEIGTDGFAFAPLAGDVDWTTGAVWSTEKCHVWFTVSAAFAAEVAVVVAVYAPGPRVEVGRKITVLLAGSVVMTCPATSPEQLASVPEQTVSVGAGEVAYAWLYVALTCATLCSAWPSVGLVDETANPAAEAAPGDPATAKAAAMDSTAPRDRRRRVQAESM